MKVLTFVRMLAAVIFAVTAAVGSAQTQAVPVDIPPPAPPSPPAPPARSPPPANGPVRLISEKTEAGMSATAAFERCFAEQIGDSERKIMRRWVLYALSRHPDTRDLVALPASEERALMRDLVNIYQTLTMRRCAAQTDALIRNGYGVSFMVGSFERAMQASMRQVGLDDAVSAVNTRMNQALRDAPYAIPKQPQEVRP